MGLLNWGNSFAGQTGYVVADDKGCQVWAPPQLPGPDFVPRYTGACKNGRAEGKGHLEWLNRYADMKVRATWDGYFKNGVYAGPNVFDHAIEPEERSNEYVVHLGAIGVGGAGGGGDGGGGGVDRGGDEVIVFAQNSGAGVMDPCAASMLGVTLNAKSAVTDDAAVKQVMLGATEKLRGICPSMSRPTVQVNVYTVPFAFDAAGRRPLGTAVARVDVVTREISGYSNSAADDVRRQAQQAEASAKLGDAKRRFADFARRNGVTAWVTTAQLDANPFRYEGRIVGVIVSLDRMATRDTALVGSGIGDGGGVVQLKGVTPEFPDNAHSVVVAARVGKREAIAGMDPSAGQLTAIQRVAGEVCSEPACDDWLDWARGPERIVWGQDYTPPR